MARTLRFGAALLLAALLAGCEVDLYSGLNEREANEMLAALSARDIVAAKARGERGDWQLRVGERQLGAALEVLRAQGLPRERTTSMGEMFQKQGLVSTPAEERMRYIHAVSQELSETLRQVDGVVAARVHVVVPANDPLSDKVRPSSAAVFIKHRPDVDLRVLAPAVKDLVAHSIEGLGHDQVSLSLFEAQPASLPAPAAAPAPAPLLGLLSPTAAAVLLALLVGGAVSLLALPVLLRRHQLAWSDFARRAFPRRSGR